MTVKQRILKYSLMIKINVFTKYIVLLHIISYCLFVFIVSLVPGEQPFKLGLILGNTSW